MDLDYQQYVSPAHKKMKMEILLKLEQIIKEWIRDCGALENKDQDTINNSGGKIFPTGSYRLDVYGPNSDIDALVVAPRHIKRQDHFFDVLAPRLRQNPDVSEMNEVRDTAVPLIKMKFQGIDIDLLFACISHRKVGNDLESLGGTDIFRGLDLASVRSLKGWRDTDMINKLVPENDPFKLCLRSIKLWAKNRGIYSNVLGYIGGVTWAILVARVCIDNPNTPSHKLLAQFFKFYSTFEWGPKNPLSICPINTDKEYVPFTMDDQLFRSWNDDKMPIITPSYPNSNSSFNISDSTKEVLLTEFTKGAMVTKAIFD